MNMPQAIAQHHAQTTLVQPCSFPATREHVNEQWLRRTLASHPAFAIDPIRKVELSDMGDGIGQLSTLTLARITCRSGRERSIVIKLQAPLPEMHAVAMAYGHYETEVNFYAQMADEVALRTPEVYVSAMDHQHERVVLVMEAFTDWHSPDQIEGATKDQIATAVTGLATLAGAYWNAPPIDRFAWLKSMAAPQFATLPDDCAGCLPTVLARFERCWPAGSAATLSTICTSFARIQRAILNGIQVVSHWDFRVENLFFAPNGDLAVIDWQLMQLNNPANDLAYLLATNVDVELRREIEIPMMEAFLTGLRRAGVRDYHMNDLQADFQLALLGISPIVVIGGANADPSNARSQQLFATMGGRLLKAIDDWQALTVLNRIS